MLLLHCQAPSCSTSEEHPPSSRPLSSYHLLSIPSSLSGLCAAYCRIVCCLGFYWAISNPLNSLSFPLTPDSAVSDIKAYPMDQDASDRFVPKDLSVYSWHNKQEGKALHYPLHPSTTSPAPTTSTTTWTSIKAPSGPSIANSHSHKDNGLL